jgi:hypothetical protein
LRLKDFIENKKVRAAAVIITAAFFILVLFFVNPAVHRYYPACWFNVLTGKLCPGCGGMRATHQLLHGHFSDAFILNPLVFIAVPVIFYAIVYYSVFLIMNKTLPEIPVNKVIIVLSSIIMLFFWIFRNL